MESYSWAHLQKGSNWDRRTSRTPTFTMFADPNYFLFTVGRTCKKEVIGIGEHRERRRPRRIGSDHMQQFHLHRIGQEFSERVGVTCDRIQRRQLPRRTLEGTSHRRIPGWIASDIDGGSVVGVDLERSCDTLLGRQQTCQVAIELTDLAIGTGCSHSITACRAGSAAHEVVAFVGSEDEQRVALIDAVVGQPGEELAKGAVVSLESCDIASLARAVGGTTGISIMGIGDEGLGSGQAMLLNGGYIGKRDGRGHAIEDGEADVALRILDGIAVPGLY